MPAEILAVIDDCAELCHIDLKNEPGTEPDQALADAIRQWFMNELFVRPPDTIRSDLDCLPIWYRSYLAFLLNQARSEALRLNPDVPLVLNFGLAGVLTDILAGRLNCQMLA